jgi:hypothetical protein
MFAPRNWIHIRQLADGVQLEIEKKINGAVAQVVRALDS